MKQRNEHKPISINENEYSDQNTTYDVQQNTFISKT
jgi:hypothetical protein